MRAMQTVTLIILTAVFLCSSVGLAATSGDTRARKRIDPRTKKPVYAESPAKAAEKPKLPKEEARIKASSSNKWMDLYEEHTFKGMPYRLLKPIDFDPSRTYPLILSLHLGKLATKFHDKAAFFPGAISATPGTTES